MRLKPMVSQPGSVKCVSTLPKGGEQNPIRTSWQIFMRLIQLPVRPNGCSDSDYVILPRKIPDDRIAAGRYRMVVSLFMERHDAVSTASGSDRVSADCRPRNCETVTPFAT